MVHNNAYSHWACVQLIRVPPLFSQAFQKMSNNSYNMDEVDRYLRVTNIMAQEFDPMNIQDMAEHLFNATIIGRQEEHEQEVLPFEVFFI